MDIPRGPPIPRLGPNQMLVRVAVRVVGADGSEKVIEFGNSFNRSDVSVREAVALIGDVIALDLDR